MESTTDRVGIRELLEAGVHFGHQAKRWNPKMKRYIFAQRAGVHIIDLDQTITLLEGALKFVRGVAEANKDVLFVGTKKQAQLPLAEQAIRSGQPYVAERYIGGMLTNFQTILPRIQYFTELAERVEATPEEEKTGKDWFALNRSVSLTHMTKQINIRFAGPGAFPPFIPVTPGGTELADVEVRDGSPTGPILTT